MRFILRLLRALFGIEPDEGVELVALTDDVFRSQSAERLPEAVRVAAIGQRSGDPKPGVRVVLTNLGGLRIDGRDEQELEVATDAAGELSVGLTITDVVGDLAVDTPDGAGEPLLFQGRSERATDAIYVDFPATVVAGAGQTEGRFDAVNFRDEPISGGAFDVCAVLDDELLVVAEAVERGGGRYEFALRFERAGAYLLHVIDLDTDARGTKPVCVLPAAPRRIEVAGPTDPRGAPPYGEVTLRVRLEDDFGNACTPSRIAATDSDGGRLDPAFREGDEANLTVRRPGFGAARLRVADSESQLSRELTVPFAAAWLANPGFVRFESPYETAVYLSAPTGRAAHEAMVRVEFDAARTAFRAFRPGPDVDSSAEAGDDAVQIRVASERGLMAEQFPDGILIGTIGWSCIGLGETCFTLTAAMSPEEEPWTFCTEQKEALENCICINIIHPPFGKRRLKKVKKDAESLPEIISSEGRDGNLQRCCPVLTVDVETTEIGRREWNRIRKSRQRGGGGLPRLGPNHDRDLARLYDLVADYRKVNCINIVLFPVARDAGYDGVMFKRDDKQGFGAIELSGVIKKRVTQHELGHALGLTHVDDPKNPMWEGRRSTNRGVGVELTAGQCRTIFQNLSKFPCEE